MNSTNDETSQHRTAGLALGVLVSFVAAAAVLVTWIFARHLSAPFYARINLDPSYAYLMNALNFDLHYTPGHTDHPGTTLQELGGIAIYMSWLLGSMRHSGDFVTDVLRAPETALLHINEVLACLIAAAVAFSTYRIFRTTGRVLLAAAAPILFLTSGPVFVSLTQVQPEPLLAALAIAAIAIGVSSENAREHWRLACITSLGLALGAGAVTKITFLPLFAFAFIFPSWRAVAFALCCASFAIAVLTIPIWPVYGAMLGFFTDVATHQGMYGDGPSGIPPVATMLANAYGIITGAPVLAVAAFCCCVALVARARRADIRVMDDQRCRFLSAGVISIACQIIIVAKHPNLHYLIPSVAASAVLIPISLQEFSVTSGGKLATSAFVFSLLVLSSVRARDFVDSRKNLVLDDMAATSEVEAKAESLNCHLIPYYKASYQTFALQFGNGYANNKYSGVLSRIYPDHIDYDMFENKFENFGGAVSYKKLAAFNDLCLVGDIPLQKNYKDFNVALVAKYREINLYKVEMK